MSQYYSFRHLADKPHLLRMRSRRRYKILQLVQLSRFCSTDQMVGDGEYLGSHTVSPSGTRQTQLERRRDFHKRYQSLRQLRSDSLHQAQAGIM